MFTQPCFIRKNTPELQEKLQQLGYKTDYLTISRGCIATSSVNGKYSIINAQDFDSTNPHITWGIDGRTDCGYNEELFLALAALRDDTDKNQWFTDGKLWEKSNNDLPSHYMQLEGHKATVKEIIEHFKDERCTKNTIK